MARPKLLRPAQRVTHQILHTQRRNFSFSPSHLDSSKVTATDAASYLLDHFANSTVTRRQTIDANQLQKLALTLNRPTIHGKDLSENPPPVGTPVPHGYHLVYFTPNGTEADLGADGTDRTFNATKPFTRRMWAGGKMKWPHSSEGSLLRVGDEVEERTRLLSATPKRSRSAGEMVLVEVEKEFWGPKGLAVVDQRSWIFRPEIDAAHPSSSPKPLQNTTTEPSTTSDIPSKDGGFPTRHLHWSPISLFRFSALTFNGHMIHYNESWTQRVENHPGLVVHGPLNLINLLNYWKDVHGEGEAPRQVSYRAMAPVYAGERYEIGTGEVRDCGNEKCWEVRVERGGVVCMRGEILA